jgi:hypothetical protein
MARATATVISIAILALGMLSAPSAQAGYLVTFQEVGSNVVERGRGSLDLMTWRVLLDRGTFRISPPCRRLPDSMRWELWARP